MADDNSYFRPLSVGGPGNRAYITKIAKAIGMVFVPGVNVSEVVLRSMLVVVIIVIGVCCIRSENIEIQWESFKFVLSYIIVLFILSIIIKIIFQIYTKNKNVIRVSSAVSDFLFALHQITALSLGVIFLSYAAASSGRPLIDAELSQIDTFLGFNWAVFRQWVTLHPSIKDILRFAYNGTYFQIMILLAYTSWRMPGGRGGELIWPFMLSLIFCTACSAIIPSAAMNGTADYLDVFYALRRGELTTLSLDTTRGVVQFPSFHAAMAVIFIYVSRHSVILFTIFLPLNLIMLVSTLPVGGHYLADTIAGAGVAGCAILASRRIVPVTPGSIGRPCRA
jgi:membrane-associated phospholipid phosphatase